MEPPEKRDRSSRVLCSATLSDGRLAEMTCGPDQAPAFIIWDGKTATRAISIDTVVGKGIPFSASNSLIRHNVVLFPSEAREYDDEQRLLSAVRSFIHRYADLSEDFEEIASAYVLLSWVFDAFRELPYLRLKGDFGSGKSRCLLTIGSLCYKPMFASGASTVSPLFRIIDSFRGTLIMDEGDFRFSDERAELIKILNNGNAAGFPVLRSEATPTKEFSPRAFEVFGPKVIATRNLFQDRALESRCITEVMAGLPPRPDIPLSLPESFDAEATELRNQLLMYRFRNRARFKGYRPAAIPDCEPRIAQVYAPLVTIVADEDARERIAANARRASNVIRAERTDTIEAQLVNALYHISRTGDHLTVKAITERFVEEFAGEYARPITPRWIGAQLRSRLALTPVKSNGVFLLGPDNAARLRALFERFQVKDIGDVGDVY